MSPLLVQHGRRYMRIRHAFSIPRNLCTNNSHFISKWNQCTFPNVQKRYQHHNSEEQLVHIRRRFLNYSLLTLGFLVVAGGYIVYEHWRSFRAAWTMYLISRLYSNFNATYKTKLQEITQRRYGPGAEGQQQLDTESQEMEEQEMEDEAFMELYTIERRKVHQKAADLLLKLCRENKGAYVKAGQYLASLSYILPKEYTDTLSILTDKAPTHSFEETVQLFREEFGINHPDEIFFKFDQEPIASASIAQVHVAYLKDTNEKVAVKIQHPGLRETFVNDIEAMKWIMFVYKLKNKFSLDWLLPEFERILHSELDFVNEAKNCERLRDMFSDNDSITAPKVHWDKTTKKIIVMEYIDGYKITDIESMEKMGISPMHIANLLIESFSKQTFEQGFIHSDLHPGNLFVQYNKKLKKPQLVYLDHGCYEELEEKTRLDYANLWKSIVFRDHEDMKFYTAQLGIDSEFYILFAMFLSAANMLDADKRSLLSTKKQSPLSKEQWRSIAKRLREKYFVGGRSTLEDIIEDMVDKNKTNKSLVLLMRANAQIRNLLYEMGVSINRFRIMAEYCVRGVHIQMRDSTKTIIDNTGHHITIPVKVRRKKPLFERIALLVELFQLRFRLFLFNVFVWLNTFFA